jgi:hypothetical protein
MDNLQLTGRHLGQVFNSRNGCMCAMHLCYEAKQPNLNLKTRPKQLLGSLPLASALPRCTKVNNITVVKSFIEQTPKVHYKCHFKSFAVSVVSMLKLDCILQKA